MFFSRTSLVWCHTVIMIFFMVLSNNPPLKTNVPEPLGASRKNPMESSIRVLLSCFSILIERIIFFPSKYSSEIFLKLLFPEIDENGGTVFPDITYIGRWLVFFVKVIKIFPLVFPENTIPFIAWIFQSDHSCSTLFALVWSFARSLKNPYGA